MAQGIGQGYEPAAGPDQGAGIEWPEIEGGEIEPPTDGRIGLKKHLEATIEEIPIRVLVSADAAPDAVTGLEDDNPAASVAECESAGEPAHPGADDDDPA